MTDAEFRERLEALGFSQSSFTRRLIELGDPRSFSTLLRKVANHATGATGVSGEMVVILNLMALSASARGKPVDLARGRPKKE